ncbi:MAG: HAMP domain-containing sensor histidine kinase [Nitrolancea sp.]
MRTLTLRRWLILSLVSIFVVPVFLFNITVLIVGGAGWWHAASQSTNQQSLDQAAMIIGDAQSRWTDPGWQRSAGQQLDAINVGAVLHDSQGTSVATVGDVPSSHPGPGRWWGSSNGPSRVVQLRDSGDQLTGSVDLYDNSTTSRQPFLAGVIAGFTGLALALIGIGWLLGHYVVRPLEAVSRAAHRIAGGDLDFAVPQSRVGEVDEVSEAFQAMGKGLRESISRQAELEEERRFYVGAIAHDLRTPLFSLRGYLQGLESGIARSPERVSEYVAICRQKADQIERLVSDLSAYTRVEFLEQTLRFSPVEIDALIDRAVESIRLRAEAKGLQIGVDRPTDSVPVQGDADLLERVLANLLDNAVRHTPADGAIEVARRIDGDRLIVSVADTGPGITMQDLPHLFDPFYRSDESRNPETGGVGLGLTIARRIMRAHGGDLTAENRPGGGALFVAWLPIGPDGGQT